MLNRYFYLPALNAVGLLPGVFWEKSRTWTGGSARAFRTRILLAYAAELIKHSPEPTAKLLRPQANAREDVRELALRTQLRKHRIDF